MSDAKYYIQNKRTIVGNSLSFWALGGHGYTCDVRVAQVFDEEDAIKLEQQSPEKYKKWPIEQILRLIQFHIDHQDLDHNSIWPHPLYRLDERLKP